MCAHRNADPRFGGGLIPDPGFPGDTGDADPAVSAAIASYSADPARYVDALAALQGSRLLVPVVALLGEIEYDADGLAHDKSSDLAAVLLQGPDGRQGLLAFTGQASLTAWEPDARPVPVSTQTAAQAAVQDQADALVIDVAGPTMIAIEGEDLVAVASGWTLARVGERTAWIKPG
ncbi:MAG: SseB family protein [Nocardioides sp.]